MQKCYIGFASVPNAAISTGKWGCGVFGGARCVKACAPRGHLTLPCRRHQPQVCAAAHVRSDVQQGAVLLVLPSSGQRFGCALRCAPTGHQTEAEQYQRILALLEARKPTFGWWVAWSLAARARPQYSPARRLLDCMVGFGQKYFGRRFYEVLCRELEAYAGPGASGKTAEQDVRSLV